MFREMERDGEMCIERWREGRDVCREMGRDVCRGRGWGERVEMCVEGEERCGRGWVMSVSHLLI